MGPVVQKPINVNRRFIVCEGVFKILNFQMLFNADIRQKLALEEFNLEKQNMQKKF